ncbi:MAG: fibrobacter succinogenes major paralogous domain-containing protein [Bacteroidales bacterium]
MGSFTSDITGLTANTTYYIRAYATNETGTGYGKELSFKTNPVEPATIITASFKSITYTTAMAGGDITYDGGGTVTERGVCWSDTNQEPTINDSRTSDGVGSGHFDSSVTGLEQGTLYFVRAYAINSAGVSYGEMISFRTYSINHDIIFKPGLIYGSVSDIEGNEYKTIQIGTMIWMAENLRTSTANDGTPIESVPGNSEWNSLSTPAFCWPQNDEVYKDLYGALYNWYSVNTGKLCPEGWHVPTDEEWTSLSTYLGDMGTAAGMLKETETIHWQVPNSGATNETGFTALPGGGRDFAIGGFYDPGYAGIWWSSTQYSDSEAWSRLMYYNSARLFRNSYIKKNGYSVRCVLD